MARGNVLNVLELKPGLWDNPEGRGITPVAEPCRYMVETNNIVIILQLKIIFFLKEHLIISPCYFLELSIQMGVYLSFSPLLFSSLVFSAIYNTSLDNHFAFLHFFSWGWF